MDSGIKEIHFKHQNGPPKKRKRVITSCSNCRKKKSKCDKGRPVCDACMKSGSSESCVYPEPDWEQASTTVGLGYLDAASTPMAHIHIQKDPSPDRKFNIKNETQTQSQQQRYLQHHQQQQQYQQQTNLPPLKQYYQISSPNSQTLRKDSFAVFPPLHPQSQFSTPYGVHHSPQSNQDLNEELYKLREKVEYLESNMRHNSDTNFTSQSSNRLSNEPEAYMSFFDYDEPVQLRAGRLIASAPLSLSSLYKNDPFLKVLLYKIRKEKKNLMYSWKHKQLKSSELVKEIIIEDKNSKIKTADEKFKATLIENENIDDVNSGKKETTETQFLNMQKLNYESETIVKIEEVLPEEKVIWILVDRFFNSILAASMPFLSEGLLREKIQEIIGIRTDHKERVKEIIISRRFDFAYMGMLLIILRLTYISVSKTSYNTLQEKYILDNPIGLNVINVAQMCLNQFKLLRRGALPIMQCCLLMRYYHKFAPEDGDGSDGGDSEVFLGMLLQMGNSIGLNRDLTNSVSLRSHDRLANMWRMLWHEIVTLDLRQSLCLGNPILIDERYADTKLPIIETKAGDNTLSNFEIHQSIVKKFELNNEINKHLRTILSDVLTIGHRVKIDDLLVKLTKLEVFIEQNFQNLNVILNLKNYTIQDTIIKLYKFVNYIELKSSLYVIYYHMFLKDKRLTYQLLMKVLEISMELNPLAYLMLTTNNERTNYFETIFGSGSQLLVLPYIIPALQKTHQIQVSLISRTLEIKFNHPDHPYMAIIDKIRTELFAKYHVVHDGYQSLSSNYFHAWRTSKGAHFLMNLLKDMNNNIWDKNSAINRECESDDVSDDINHFKQFPSFNELLTLSKEQLEKVLDLISTRSYDESVLSLLNKRKKGLSRISHMQYDPNEQSSLPPAQQSFQKISSSISKLLQDPVPHVSHLKGPSSVGSANSETNSAKSDTEFHLNKNSMTNTEIDRLWIQMMASNTLGNLKGTTTNEISNNDVTQEHGLYSSLDQDPLNEPTNGRANGYDQGEVPNTSKESNGNGNMNLDGPIGAFGTLDLEKLISDTSPYDMFGDIPFYNDI